MIPVQRYQFPRQQSLAFFSGKPASFFTGVVAGTEGSSLRRWNSGKGTASRHGGSQDLFLEPLPDSQVVSGTSDVEPVSRRWEKRSTCSLQVAPPASWMEADSLDTEIESCLLERGSLDTRMLETDLLNVESEAGLLEDDPVSEDGVMEADLLSVESEAGLLEDDPLLAVSEVRASLRRRRVGVTRRARRAALRAGALCRPAGRRVRTERIEAGSDFASQFCSCDPPLVRLNRVNDIICESQSRFQSCLSQNSLAHNSHSMLHIIHTRACLMHDVW